MRKINPTYDYMEQIEMFKKLGLIFYLPDNVTVTMENINNFYWEENDEKYRKRLEFAK
jgi:hypothetical protein